MPEKQEDSEKVKTIVSTAIQTAVQSVLQYDTNAENKNREIDLLKLQLEELRKEVDVKSAEITAAAEKADRVSSASLSITTAMAVVIAFGFIALLAMAFDFFYYERSRMNELLMKDKEGGGAQLSIPKEASINNQSKKR